MSLSAPDFTQLHVHDDKPREYCGVFGVFNSPAAATHVALGLHALQHRGQEAVGIVSCDGEKFFSRKALGLVGDNFSDQQKLKLLQGQHAIGHNRYSTTGGSDVKNIQPLYADFATSGVALAHNGNLTNGLLLRQELTDLGAVFHSTTDSEVLLHLMAMLGPKDQTLKNQPTRLNPKPHMADIPNNGVLPFKRRLQPSGLLAKPNTGHPMADRLWRSLPYIQGAYALLCLTHDALIGVRDPFGIRPLVLGQLHDSYILASESVALDMIGAKFIRDIAAGEMVMITNHGVVSHQIFSKRLKPRTCLFEYVYFARPDSIVDGISVYQARKNMGKQLALEAPIDADIVVPVPDSGVPAALGFAEQLGVPFDLGIIRNHYVGRIFIQPTPNIRDLGVRLKHNANAAVLKGKKVVLIDDSLVRGTTAAKIATLVRDAGAKQVSMRISSPPVKYPCYYGIDLPNPKELLAAHMSVSEIAKGLGLDDLAFLSLDGLYRSLGETKGRDATNPQFTDHYFTGDYPVPLLDRNYDRKNHLSWLAETA